MNTRTPFFALAAGIALGAQALAGGPEMQCDGTPVIWGIAPGTTIQWSIARTMVSATECTVVPGFACTPCSTGAGARPGTWSMVRAARQWTRATHPWLPATAGASNVSFMQLDDPFTSYVSTSPGSNLVVNDGTNVVTCFQSDSYWDGLGDPFGITVTWLDASNQIIEADMALNAIDDDDSVVLLEENNYTGLTYVNQNPPTGRLVDLRGLVTHELGHFLGLSHSLVESQRNALGSDQPTMFPIADGAPFTGTVTAPTGSGCSTTTLSLSDRVLFARASTSVELDDIIALATAYPKPVFSAALGSIEGTVLDQDDSGIESRLQAAHVVAIAVNDPTTRVGTYITPNDGTYTIRGLRAGDYHVMIEPIETGATPYAGIISSIPSDTFVYAPTFLDGDLPTIYQGQSSCPDANDPPPAFAVFNAEMHSTADTGPSECEADQMYSSAISVSNNSTTNCRFLVARGSTPGLPGTGTACQTFPLLRTENPSGLWVGLANEVNGTTLPGATLSPHGIGYGDLAQDFTTTFLVAAGGTTSSGNDLAPYSGPVTLRLSTELDLNVRADGRVELIDNGLAFTTTGTIPSTNPRIARFDFLSSEFPPTQLGVTNFVDIFAQAEFGDMLTNIVVIRMNIENPN